MTAPSDLAPLTELYSLWRPVYPFLARHVATACGRTEGRVLEVGPFCGLTFTLLEEGVGTTYTMAPFSEELREFFAAEAERLGLGGRVAVLRTDEGLSTFGAGSVDLLIFRGALFFPGMFTLDLGAIHRVLSPSGVAFVGGGFGRYTPSEVISLMADRSRELNAVLGKTEVRPADFLDAITAGLLPGKVELEQQGGLWLIMRK